MRTRTGHENARTLKKRDNRTPMPDRWPFLPLKELTMTTNTTPATDAVDQAAQTAQAEQAAPEAINFESDEPLSGGVCDMSAGCEACQ